MKDETTTEITLLLYQNGYVLFKI